MKYSKQIQKIIIKTLVLPLSLISSVALAQVSPNGKIKVEYVSASEAGQLQVRYKGPQGWQSIMKMDICLGQGKIIHSKKAKKVDYEMLLGKKKHCTNVFCESSYPLADGCRLRIKAYNDGITWSRDSTPGNGEYKGHHVDFSYAKANWLMKWTDSYEGFFPKNRETKEGERYGYPALFEYENNVFALLSESNIGKNCAASSFYATSQSNHYLIRPDGKAVEGDQTLIIGSLNDVVESTLITDNSQPCALDDVSWIKPGVASWIYWAYNHGSNDINIIRKYIDLAVKMKLPYVLIDAEWDEMPKIASNQGKTIEDAVKECIEAGIKPIIWYNSSVGWVNGAPGPKFRLNNPDDREKEFAWCEKIGVKGVKIDFFSGDNNLNIRYMIELLECAAKHHLLVNFHGATVPRGWQRTYPNLVSTEGVYGAEWYNNVPTFTDKAARHNATLPFTRNVIGSMDYTPCAFSDSQHPHITTHAHELALTVVFESGIQHLADRPESFLAQPQAVRDFLSSLPTAWDETRLLSGYPGEYVVMARRKGHKWYVAGINGTDEEQTLDFALLKKYLKKQKKAHLFLDSNDRSKSNWNLVSCDEIGEKDMKIKCQPRGGFVITIE